MRLVKSPAATCSRIFIVCRKREVMARVTTVPTPPARASATSINATTISRSRSALADDAATTDSLCAATSCSS